MSLTLAEKQKYTSGGCITVTAKVTFDDSYPTGGESLTPAMIGLKKIRVFQTEPASGYVFEYNYTTQKLKAYRTAPAGSVAAPVFTNSGSTSTFTNSGSTFVGTASQTHTFADLSSATVVPLVMSGTVLGISGSAVSGVGSGALTAPAGTVTAAGTIATTAAGTIAAPAFTGTKAALSEVDAETNLSAVITRIVVQGIG